MDIITQAWIVVLGCASIWLVGRREHWKRWGFVLGLLSQPAWFYATIKAEQWGMVALSAWYTYAWIQGTYNHWRK